MSMLYNMENSYKILKTKQLCTEALKAYLEASFYGCVQMKVTFDGKVKATCTL